MQRKAGFTLIECTAYLSGLLILVCVVATFTQSMAQLLMTDLTKQRDNTQLAYAVQLLARDIHAASPAPKDWKCDKSSLLFHHDTTAICWQITDSWLYRRQAKNPKTRQCQMPAFACELIIQEGYVRGLKITKPISRTIPVKNGPIS